MIDLDLVMMAREILSPDLVDRRELLGWVFCGKDLLFQEVVPRLVVGLVEAFRTCTE